MLNTPEFSKNIPSKEVSGISSKASSAKSNKKSKIKKLEDAAEDEDDDLVDPLEEAEGQERYFSNRISKKVRKAMMMVNYYLHRYRKSIFWRKRIS